MPTEPALEAPVPPREPPVRTSWWARRRVVVHDESMLPTLRPGDRLYVDLRSYRSRAPRVGEIVVVRDPEARSRWLVKRVQVVGPGTWWATHNGRVVEPDSLSTAAPSSTTGAGVAIPFGPGAVWVVGDDPERSRDSRRFGPISPSDVVGRVIRCYAPEDRRRDL
jgi:signal peptidase I